MRDFKERLDKLLSDADDCELIGNLATDPAKRVTFRRIASQFHKLAAELKAQMAVVTTLAVASDEHFLLQEAEQCHDLATSTSGEKVATELQRLPAAGPRFHCARRILARRGDQISEGRTARRVWAGGSAKCRRLRFSHAERASTTGLVTSTE